jgi:hypothetical protein
MQQLITGLLLVVWILLNVFRTSLRPSSGAYQLQQQQPLVYRWSVVIAVLLVVVGPVGPDHDQQHCYHQGSTVNQRLLLLQLIGSR